MISFENDYVEGAHPKILQRLIDTNTEQVTGYCRDPYCESARKRIREACHCPWADVFFLVGGTQTNKVVIDAMLKIYEGVVSADSGHINMHESGAVEATGRKVIPLNQYAGKIRAAELQAYLERFYGDVSYEHMVFPGMVYISQPTEYGTLYSLKELKEIHEICKKWKIPLFIDGARLIYGLASPGADFNLADIAKYCDVFYIGGTKAGAFCGEAVVFPAHNTPKHFVSMAKRQGALLAKGRLLGVQFDALFSDELYMEIGKHAIDRAEQMKKIFREKGYHFFVDSPTNQQFLLVENTTMETLMQKVRFSIWEKPDSEHTVIRFVTSWATTEHQVEKLKDLL